MEKKFLFCFLFVVGLVLFWSSYGFAYTIDGYLSDWGVIPFSDWEPWDRRVDYIEEDGTSLPYYPGYIGSGSYPLDGEKFDIEAMYFDDDPAFIYLAMVTSFPFSGRDRVVAGDISLGFGVSGDYDYGLKVQGLTSADYGHSYIPLKRLRDGESWAYCAQPEAGPIYLAEGVGENIGLAEIYYWNATYGGGPYNEPGTNIATWVLEAKINRLLFAGLAEEGETIRLHHAMDCGKDYIDLSGDFDSPIIPEPMSPLLLTCGLLGLSGLKRKVFS